MTNKLPLVSIVAPSFNHKSFIKECLDSVIDQTYPNWELIIIDDGSTDGSVEIIKEYAKKDTRINFLKSPFNQGMGATITQAASLAKGKYIAILNTDDAYLPTKLEKQVDYLEKKPKCGAVFSHINIIDEHGTSYEHDIKKQINISNMSREDMLRKFWFDGNFIASPTELIRSEIFKKIGYYKNSLPLTGDFDTHLRVLFNHDIHIVEEPLMNYRYMRDSSNTSAPSKANSFRAKNEMEILLDTFLELKDLKLFNLAFGLEATRYGKPLVETIPYFFARMAIDGEHADWGYRTICRIMNDTKTYQLLNELYGFSFKDFLGLSAVGAHNTFPDERKQKRRKLKAKIIRIILMISLLANVVFLGLGYKF